MIICGTGDRQSLCKGAYANRNILMAVSATGTGKGGVLERPVIERTSPGRESEFDLRYYIPKIFIANFVDVFHLDILKINLLTSLGRTIKLYIYLFIYAIRCAKLN